MPEPKGRRRPAADPSLPLRNIEGLSRALTPTPVTVPLRSDFPEPFPSANEDELIATGSSAIYHGIRSRLHPDAFARYEGSRFPISPLNEPAAKGQIELRPRSLDDFPALPPAELEALAARMWEYRSELSPLDADVLDGLTYAFLSLPRTASGKSPFNIDAFLDLRGIKPKKGGHGRRGGYMPDQRREVLRSLYRLQSLWLRIDEAPEYQAGNGKKPRPRAMVSRAVTLSDYEGQTLLEGGIDADRVLFVLGEPLALYLMGAGRQTALLSAKALRYDPYREAPEKELTRYLSYLWRVRAGKGAYRDPLRVATLLEKGRIGLEERPDRRRKRLEDALDRLQRDGVLSSWRYDGWELGTAPARGWATGWLQALVIIEPPAAIPAHYAGELRGALPMLADTRLLPERMRATRERLRLSQEAAAEACGLAQQTYSRAERGASLSPENRAKIEAWLAASMPPGDAEAVSKTAPASE